MQYCSKRYEAFSWRVLNETDETIGARAMKTRFVALGVAILMMLATGVMAAGGVTPPTISTPANMQMLTSRLAMFSYAKDSVAMAEKYIGSMGGIIQPGGVTDATVYGQNPDVRIIETMLGQRALSFDVLTPSAQQYQGVQLMDAQGSLLFYGSVNYTPVQDPTGQWVIPASASNVELVMADYIPIYVPGTNVAYVVVTDAQGNEQWVWLNVYNGHVQFPVSMAGIAGGELIIGIGNTGATYSTTTGEKIPTTHFESNGTTSIKGLITLDDPSYISIGVGKAATFTENPLFQVAFTAEKNVNLYAIAPNGELATQVVMRLVGGDLQTIQLEEGSLNCTFGAGVWDIWFEFPTWGQDQPTIPPYQGGGMG